MSQLFLHDELSDISLGTNNTNKAGTAVAWRARVASPVVGDAGNVTATVATVTGPTNGLETGNPVNEWISPPLAAAVTISGTLTFNICGLESSAMANAGLGVVVQRVDNVGTVVSTIADSVQLSELATGNSRRTWTATPTSTAMAKGDRFRIRVYFDDAGGTMATGYTLTLTYDGTNAALGDSNVDFAETLSFVEPRLLEQSVLVSSDLQSGDYFGGAIACSADGSVVVVGAQSEDGAGLNRGAAYVLSGAAYATQVKLTPSTPEDVGGYGYSVACSDDGAVVVVGTSFYNGAGVYRGLVDVFSGANYATRTTLAPTVPEDEFYFGDDIACSGDGSVIVVGAPGADNGGFNRGAAYVFSGTNYATQVKLTGSDSADSDVFGTAVACSPSGNVVVVGAPSHNLARGAVYVYSGTNYATQVKLTASDAQDNDNLGWVVACSADGSQVFGGANNEDGAGLNRGAVYVWSGVNYATQVKLTAPVPQDLAQFGSALACSNDGSRLVVGAFAETENFGTGQAGSVYVLSGSNYETVTKLGTTTTDDVEEFGRSVACSNAGDVVVAGAPMSNASVASAGRAYVHRLTNRMYLTATTSDITDQGASVTELTAWTAPGNG